MIAPGRVFRNEEVDASHEHTFYQLEGMMVDRDVSVAHLIYFMKTLLSAIFKRDVTVRLRPGYFPFVEPGFELDIQCLICGGTGLPGLQAERLGGTACRAGWCIRTCCAWAASIPKSGTALLRPGPDAPGDDALRHRRHPPAAGRRPAISAAVLSAHADEVLLQLDPRTGRRPGCARARTRPAHHDEDGRVRRRRTQSASTVARSCAARVARSGADPGQPRT